MRTLVGFVLLVATGGCLRPALVECGDLACAPSQVCHQERCLDPSQLDVCVSVDEGTSCDALGAPGHCTDGVCEVATCGDGHVDDDLREQCDDTVPDAHCIDFGYDIGRPACTECQPDATMGCTRFGWERIIDAPTFALWTDGATFAYLTSSGLTVRTATSTVVVPGSFTGVHGGGGHVVAYHSTGYVDVIGGVATMRVLPRTDQLRVGPNGTIYTLHDCIVSRIDGDRREPIGPQIDGPFCGRFEVGATSAAGTRIYVAAGTPLPNRVFSWDETRGQFLPITLAGSPITDLKVDGDLLWISTVTGAAFIDADNKLTPVDVGFGPISIALTPDATYFGNNDGAVARIRGNLVQQLRAPGPITGDGAVFAYRGPIYRFTGVDYGSRAPLSSQLEVVASLQDTNGTVRVATTSALYAATANGREWAQTSTPPTSTRVRAMAGIDGTYFISDFHDQAPREPKLFALTEGVPTWTPRPVPNDPLLYGLWWAPTDSTLFAVGDNDAGDAFFGVHRGTTMWETAIRVGCTVRGVHGIDATRVIAVGGCGTDAVVWAYSGTQWTELARPALPGPLLAALHLDNGSLVVTGAGGTARFDGWTWSVDTGVAGAWLSGTSDGDIWVSGTFTSVQHFDGVAWSKLAVQASGSIAVMTSPDRVLFPGATEGFVELVR